MDALVSAEVTGVGKSLVAVWPVTDIGPVPGMAARVFGEAT